MKIKNAIIVLCFVTFGYLCGALTVYWTSVLPANKRLLEAIEIPKISINNEFDKIKGKKDSKTMIEVNSKISDTTKTKRKLFKKRKK